MIVSSLPPATEELREAVAWYNAQRTGLGYEFVIEFEDTLDRITKLPTAWEKLSKNVRCCRLNRFPYGVLYTVRNDEILVVAVMHLHRKPGYWEGRVP
jgi:hypothetical protein